MDHMSERYGKTYIFSLLKIIDRYYNYENFKGSLSNGQTDSHSYSRCSCTHFWSKKYVH